MLEHAFKEWAVICRALAEGRQAIILRKGGIDEIRDGFRLRHTRFWLFPTWTHQQREGIKPEAAALLAEVEAERPPEGVVRLSHFAEAGGVYHVHQLLPALMISGLHLWSEETVRARFDYRRSGLFVIPVRVYRAAQMFELPSTAEYEGCRSWVELGRELPTEGATPVLGDEAFREVLNTLDGLLNPTALA